MYLQSLILNIMFGVDIYPNYMLQYNDSFLLKSNSNYNIASHV